MFKKHAFSDTFLRSVDGSGASPWQKSALAGRRHALQRPGEGLVQEGFFQVVEGGQFLLVEGFEALDSGFVHYDFTASGCFGGS
jgi:hypothetical protein